MTAMFALAARAPAGLHIVAGPESGPPLLLLHGVLRAGRDFDAVAPMLLPRWHVHALDFRGHGQSAWAPGKYRVVDYNQDVLGALRETIPAPAFLFGHSLGAMTALAAAAAAPDRVRGIILEDPPFDSMGRRIEESGYRSIFAAYRDLLARGFRGRELARSLARIPIGGGKKLGDVRDAVSLRFSAYGLERTDPAVLEPILEARWLEGYDLESIARGVSCPVLILQGDGAAGGLLAEEDARVIESAAADVTLVRFPGVGHLVHATQPERVIGLTTNFLNSL